MSEAKRPRLGGAVDSVEVDSLAGLVDILCAQSPAAAARSWRMALLAMMLPDLSPALDSSKCMMMALVHDLATALQYAPPGEQQQETTPPVVGVAEDAPAGAVASREGGAAMLKLRDTKLKGMESSASRVYELWEEYDAAKTPEAKAVRDLAAVAAAVRGNRQQCSEGGTELSPSPALAATCSTPACKQLLAEIKRRREDAAPAGTAVSPVQQGESERAAPRAPPPGVSQRTSMPLPTPQLKPPPGGTKPQPQPIQPPLRQQPAPGPPPTLQRLTVDNAHVGSILGKGGCNISRVRATSGAQVKIHEAAPGSTVR
jgi:5'-deoxynucleotidase YfbR-like HD superfamily hydrolase